MFKVGIVFVLIWLAGIVGWVMNLVAVVQLFVADAPFTTMFIGRIIGLPFFPLGAILGYF